MSDSATPQLFDFTATGTIETFVVPQTGTYYLSADGAGGGGNGGGGGYAGGNFSLTQGETLLIAVGVTGAAGAGYQYNAYVSFSLPAGGGGGGASYIVLQDGAADVPLVVAGGGGGSFGTTMGAAGGEVISGSGQGGSATGYADDGGGGAGFYGQGQPDTQTGEGLSYSNEMDGVGGADFAQGLAGGAGGSLHEQGPLEGYGDSSVTAGSGGFGGGGGGGVDYGGGGGGYTGGASGGENGVADAGGQGGSSYVVYDTIGAPNFAAGVQFGDGEVVIEYPSCFAEGTRIATPSGPARVETLRAGDMVISHLHGRPVPVQWVCCRRIDCARLPDPAKAYPVRIRAGAFGPGLPVRDLLLSPDHAVFAEGVLIPVRVLVNGGSVAVQPVSRVTYWHVDVCRHDILLAEGLPAESYLNADGRAAFIGGPVRARAPDLASRVWEAAGCAPLRLVGPEVDAVRARIDAMACGWSNGSMDTARRSGYGPQPMGWKPGFPGPLAPETW